VKSITTFHYPLADTRQLIQTSHDFEQSLLVWAVVAGLRAVPGLRWSRAVLGREMASKLRAGHISTTHTSGN